MSLGFKSLIVTGNKYCVEKLSVVEELEVSRRAEQERVV
jgi:hypothetical protein